MLFYQFSSQEERKECGGSYFIEMQYCRLQHSSEIEDIVSVNAIKNWKNDSLYIYGDSDNEFVLHYGEIFNIGTYNNLQSGIVDMCGINYYSKENTRTIIEKVKEKKPLDYPILLDWLERCEDYNGFYVLGL